MVDKSMNKFNNNFLQRFLSNNCKSEIESKIETNHGYIVEITDHSSNNLLSLLNCNNKPLDPFILSKSKIMNHLEKKLNRNDNSKKKKIFKSGNNSKDNIKSNIQKNAVSPPHSSHKIKSNKTADNDIKDSNNKLLKIDKSDEKIVLKSSSKLTFSPNFSNKKIEINNFVYNKYTSPIKKKNVPEKNKSFSLLKNRKPSKDEHSKNLTHGDVTNKKYTILIESRKKFNQQFSKLKHNFHNDSANHTPNSPNSTGFIIDDDNKRCKSENKNRINKSTRISLFNYSKSKVNGNCGINTSHNSSSPSKKKERINSDQNSLIFSSDNNSEMVIGCSPDNKITDPKQSKIEIDDSIGSHNLNINYNFLEKEENSIRNKCYSANYYLNKDEVDNQNNVNRECFIKNKYKCLLDNFNKNNISNNVIIDK